MTWEPPRDPDDRLASWPAPAMLALFGWAVVPAMFGFPPAPSPPPESE